jgi:hypothetical protein
MFQLSQGGSYFCCSFYTVVSNSHYRHDLNLVHNKTGRVRGWIDGGFKEYPQRVLENTQKKKITVMTIGVSGKILIRKEQTLIQKFYHFSQSQRKLRIGSNIGPT